MRAFFAHDFRPESVSSSIVAIGSLAFSVNLLHPKLPILTCGRWYTVLYNVFLSAELAYEYESTGASFVADSQVIPPPTDS